MINKISRNRFKNELAEGTYNINPNEYEETELLKGNETVNIDNPYKMTYFEDGERRIDFVLAYTESSRCNIEDREKRTKIQTYRKNYLNYLQKMGLQLEESESVSNCVNEAITSYFRPTRTRTRELSIIRKKKAAKIGDKHHKTNDAVKGTIIEDDQPSSVMCYVKVHAPFDVLCETAEDMQLKMPMKEYDIDIKPWYASNPLYKCFHSIDPFVLNERNTREEKQYFVAQFDQSRLTEYINHDNPDLFFIPSERSRLVYNVLEKSRFGTNDTDVGFYNLQRKGVFADAYPLHDGPVRLAATDIPVNDRQRLQADWATVKCLFKYQPINAIKEYFGEEVAMYFSWLGFYTTFLLPASIVGILCFLYGVTITVTGYSGIADICDVSKANSTHYFYMCPECNKVCCYYLLHTIGCLYAKLTLFFDNESTVLFSTFMSIWATLFLEFWKRKQVSLAYHWHSIDFQDELEQVRPEYAAKVAKLRKNPITGKYEPYMPIKERISRIFGTFAVVSFFVILILVALFGVIIFRTIFLGILYSQYSNYIKTESLERSKLYASLCAGILNLIVINVLNLVYEKIAVRLTDWENPRTRSAYEDSFTIKMFWFQFFNTYSSIIYVAFFKFGLMEGSPATYRMIVKYRFDKCSVHGCFLELTIQLIIIMVGQQVIGNIMEIALPYLQTKYNQWKVRKYQQISIEPQWVEDFNLEMQTKFSLFWQYLEIVLQYGFVTMFVAAFPLAPFFAILNNMFEIRLDAYNFVNNFRRPVALKAEDIGAWYGILATLTTFSTIVNAFVIAFTSELIPRMTYQYLRSPDGTMRGFTNYTLSYFDVSDFSNETRPNNAGCNGVPPQTHCRYPGYRQPFSPYNRTTDYWVILVARLAFIISFQAFVLAVTWAIAYVIPDVPKSLQLKMKREQYLAAEAEKDYKERMGYRKPRDKDELNEDGEEPEFIRMTYC